ncbi:unnamed protein product [Ilex paraguariensis]|uniref:Uncharacterized protein n=1 Tax=Ilex paraguariensis TaxID=185542 RepID=A0ABC8UDP5_9AQUA
MMEKQVTILLYWGGRMEYGSEGLSYSCPPKGEIVINSGAQLLKLLSKIYTVIGLDRAHNKLKLTCRYHFTLGIGPIMNTYVGLKIDNDELVTSMVNVVLDNPNIASVVLYVEMEECPTSRVTGECSTPMGMQVMDESGMLHFLSNTHLPMYSNITKISLIRYAMSRYTNNRWSYYCLLTAKFTCGFYCWFDV